MLLTRLVFRCHVLLSAGWGCRLAGRDPGMYERCPNRLSITSPTEAATARMHATWRHVKAAGSRKRVSEGVRGCQRESGGVRGVSGTTWASLNQHELIKVSGRQRE